MDMIQPTSIKSGRFGRLESHTLTDALNVSDGRP